MNILVDLDLKIDTVFQAVFHTWDIQSCLYHVYIVVMIGSMLRISYHTAASVAHSFRRFAVGRTMFILTGQFTVNMHFVVMIGSMLRTSYHTVAHSFRRSAVGRVVSHCLRLSLSVS